MPLGSHDLLENHQIPSVFQHFQGGATWYNVMTKSFKTLKTFKNQCFFIILTPLKDGLRCPQELQLRHHLELQRPKTYENQWNSYDFQCFPCPTGYWDLMGSPGASWGLLGPPWGIRGASLGPPWGSLGPPWGPPSPLPPLSPPPLYLRLFLLPSPLINYPTHRCILQSRYSMDM